MAEGRFAQVVLLVEDGNQARFVSSWLVKHAKVSSRDIRVVRCPKIGGGAGEKFVRDKFLVERDNHRTCAKRRGSLLIVVIDADLLEVAARRKQLAGLEAVPEGVFVFIPKRNIETWFRALNGEEPDESTDYKRQGAQDYGREVKEAARRFLELVRGTQDEPLIASLAEGVREARRIPRDHIPAS
jgi:hypothetical protein